MGKDVIIAEILELPVDEQREIFDILRNRFGEDLSLSEAQVRELDRRYKKLEKEGSSAASN